ncbi:TRAP transporter permease [Chloroflexota bacterium]
MAKSNNGQQPESLFSEKQRRYKGVLAKVVMLVAVALSSYSILSIGGFFLRLNIVIHEYSHRSIFLGCILIMVFLLLPMKKTSPRDRLPWYDAILILIVVGVCGYAFSQGGVTYARAEYLVPPTIDVIMGSILLFLVLEATRRALGLILPTISSLFILHAMFCNYLPGILHGKGYSWAEVISNLFLGTDGFFGLATGVAANVIIVFIIFGQFLQVLGGGDFFSNVAFALLGRFRGGPAKGAVVASALFGTLSGSTIANVATTGVITIPLMKRTGYKPHFAAAVEAVSSNGGQIMPPVMGGVAFIMCEFIDVTYIQVCIAAAVPAILYYLVEFIQVDLEAARLGLKGLPSGELPSFKQTMKEGWHYLIPLIILVYLLAVLLYSPQYASLYATASLIIISLFKKGKRITPKTFRDGLEHGGRGMLIVGCACATAGIVIGAIGISGFGQRLTAMLANMAGGNVVLLLLVATVAAFVLGMGMVSLPCYILVAVLISPALIKAGVVPMAAHLGAFYWGLMSFITPPVCVAAYAAASIAGSKPFQTGWTATRLGVVTFVVPFVFCLFPALVLVGSFGEIVLAVITSVAGCTLLAAGVAGYGLRPINWLERAIFLTGALFLILPGTTTDVIGGSIAVLVLLYQYRAWRRAPNKVSVGQNDTNNSIHL